MKAYEPEIDAYRVLQLDPTASAEVIVGAYRALAKALHPDVSGISTTARMALVNAAFEILRDPATRAEYDRQRRSWLSQSGPANPHLDGVTMPFGKHRGKRIVDVPTAYLAWLVSAVDNRPWLISVVSEELERRGFRVQREAHA